MHKIGVELWQHDLWWQIVSAALRGVPDKPKLDYHSTLSLPAISRYAATTPEVLKWFDTYNRNKPYHRQVRPFGFMVSLLVKAWSKTTDSVGCDTETDRRKRLRPVRAVAPFTREPSEAADNAFDRESSDTVPREALKSYRQGLAQYHLHPEGKFRSADYSDSGVTERRHVFAPSRMVRHIGKEANKWQQQSQTGLDEDAEIEYASPLEGTDRLVVEAERVVGRAGVQALAKKAGISERHLRGLVSNERSFGTVAATKLKLAIKVFMECDAEPSRSTPEMRDRGAESARQNRAQAGPPGDKKHKPAD